MRRKVRGKMLALILVLWSFETRLKSTGIFIFSKELEKLEASLHKRTASKSPYDGVKPKINNRSVTVGKY